MWLKTDDFRYEIRFSYGNDLHSREKLSIICMINQIGSDNNSNYGKNQDTSY